MMDIQIIEVNAYRQSAAVQLPWMRRYEGLFLVTVPAGASWLIPRRGYQLIRDFGNGWRFVQAFDTRTDAEAEARELTTTAEQLSETR